MTPARTCLALLGLAFVACGDGFLPPAEADTLVGEIVQAGVGIMGLGMREDVLLEIRVEARPRVTFDSCDQRFFSVRPDTEIQLWRHAHLIGEGSVADLERGRLVRARAAGPCLGSCPGLCGAADIDVFTD